MSATDRLGAMRFATAMAEEGYPVDDARPHRKGGWMWAYWKREHFALPAFWAAVHRSTIGAGTPLPYCEDCYSATMAETKGEGPAVCPHTEGSA